MHKKEGFGAVKLGVNERDRAAPAVLDAVIKSSCVEIVVVVGEGCVSCRTARRKRARQPCFGEPSACALADVTEEKEQRVAKVGRQGGDPGNFRFGFIVVFDWSEDFGGWGGPGGSGRGVERGCRDG
jgi:hypothetical protein